MSVVKRAGRLLLRMGAWFALIYTFGLIWHWWALGDMPSTMAYLAGYGAAALTRYGP